ncbi:MAG: glutathione S-transferase family protein [Verrucomicrobia bacterium]|nr:glutathione S-transferase family protein [Verrucomicrobiota bacterium]
MMKLFELRHSPYCIPIVRMLEGFSIPFQRREVPNWDRREIGRLTGGAYYQVPVVVDGDEVIHDLPGDPYRVARHIDTRYGGGRLFPPAWTGIHEMIIGEFEDRFEGAGFKLCDIHHVASIADPGERAMVIRHKERRFGVGCLEQWRRDEDSLRAAFESLIEPLDQRLRASPFLLGNELLFADLALYGVLGNYTYQGWNQVPGRMAGLRKWVERVAGWSAVKS